MEKHDEFQRRLESFESIAEHGRQSIKEKLQYLLNFMEGQYFESQEEKQDVARRISQVIKSIGMRVKCTVCGRPAVLSAPPRAKGKRSPYVYFLFVHSAGKRTTHCHGVDLPHIEIIDTNKSG